MTTNSKWALIANGEKLSPKRFADITNNRSIIACDGGLASCLEQGIIPDIVLGDFDSIEPAALQKLKKSKCEIIQAIDQSKTDSEKALIHLISLDCQDIIMCQVFGDRTDHSLINLQLLKQYHAKIENLILFREAETVQYAENETITIHGKPGNGIAIMGFPEAKVTTCGLTYECNKLELNITGMNSGCNSLAQAEATIDAFGSIIITKY